MNKKQLPVITGILVGVALMALAVSLLIGGMRDHLKSRGEHTSDFTKLRNLYRGNPFPSTENINAEKANLAAALKWRDRLREEVGGVPPKTNIMTPIGFQVEMERVTSGLRRLASAGAGESSMVSSDFYFGFDYYVDQFAKKENVARLTAQLELVDDVTRILFEAGVSTLNMIDRDRFDGTKGSGGNRGVVFGADSDDPLSRNPEFISADEISEGLKRERITVDFTATQGALANVLNRVASHKRFIVVSKLTSVKTGTDFRLPDVEHRDDPEKADAESVKRRAIPMKKRIVCGVEIDQPLKVHMDLDVYWMDSTTVSETGEREVLPTS